MEKQEDNRTVMVGFSFDELAVEASAAVKREIDRQMQEVTPRITQALDSGTAALNEANRALAVAQNRIRRYRLLLSFLLGLCLAEGSLLAMLHFFIKKSLH